MGRLLACLMWLSFSCVTLAFTPPSSIHLDLSSKKVPTQRNQLEIQFSAWTDSGGYEGVFMAHSEGAAFVTTTAPPSFWFSLDPFRAAIVLSFPSDGLYRVYGNLYNAPMLAGNVPEGLEADPLLATSVLLVKVVQGNAIEISENQYLHEVEKSLREKNQARAWGRVEKELRYVVQNSVEDFIAEEGAFEDRFVPVENEMGANIIADNGDIHQAYLLENIGIICPFPKCKTIPFCKKYMISANLNQLIHVTGNIRHENLAMLQYPSGTPATPPLAGYTVTIAVRAFVYVQGKFCTGIPELSTIYSIKTLLHTFYTDENGNIDGYIYAAPPFDGGLPYAEYIETHAKRVYEVHQGGGASPPICDWYDYQWLDGPFGQRQPDSLMIPAICQDIEGQVACIGQVFDPATNTFTLDAVFREQWEPRTFFLMWDTRLQRVADSWAQWAVGDTCRPLQAAWVSNYADTCFACDSVCSSHANFECFGQICPEPGEQILDFNQPHPKPSLFIKNVDDVYGQLAKWQQYLPYHETGHWLYYLMNGKTFILREDPASDPDRNINTCNQKVTGELYLTPGCSLVQGAFPLNQFTEAFAEAHMLHYSYVVSSGYARYEWESDASGQNEIDTVCEPRLYRYETNYSGVEDEIEWGTCKDSTDFYGTYCGWKNYPITSTDPLCIECANGDGDYCEGPAGQNSKCCRYYLGEHDSYNYRCKNWNTLWQKKVVGEMTAFLMDIVDGMPSLVFDREIAAGPVGGNPLMDNISHSLSSVFHCLKNDPITVIGSGGGLDDICTLIYALENKPDAGGGIGCVPSGALTLLREFYGLDICP